MIKKTILIGLLIVPIGASASQIDFEVTHVIDPSPQAGVVEHSQA